MIVGFTIYLCYRSRARSRLELTSNQPPAMRPVQPQELAVLTIVSCPECRGTGCAFCGRVHVNVSESAPYEELKLISIPSTALAPPPYTPNLDPPPPYSTLQAAAGGVRRQA